MAYDAAGFELPYADQLVVNTPDPAALGQSILRVTGTPLSFFPAPPGLPTLIEDAVGRLTVSVRVSAAGELLGGDPTGPDFSLAGTVDTDGDGSSDFSGILLAGEVTHFGFEDVSLLDEYEFRIRVTGGLWASTQFAGKDVGLSTISPNSGLSTESGLFAVPFVGGSQGILGAIEPVRPASVPGSIAGTKYRDLTNNGLTADDTPLGGVGVYLDLDNDVSPDPDEPFQTTLDNGSYKFSNLTPGTYTVREVVPAGYVQTAPAGGGAYAVTLAATGTDSAGNDFANYLLPTTGAIRGRKVRDLTADGLSADDAPLADVRIYLDANDDGTWDPAERSVLTGADGSYAFLDLPPTPAGGAPYVVREVVPAGYVRTTPAAADHYDVAVVAGQTAAGKDFANYLVPPSSIRGTKYLDRTGDGLTPADDVPLAGVTVYLDANGNKARDPGEPARVTDGGGNYTFADLAPGTYTVREVVPAGYAQTFPAAGGSYTVTLALTGTDSAGNDFANYLLPTTGGIGGRKVRDLTNNGWSGDDAPLPGVTIYLDANNNGQFDAAGPGAEKSTVTGGDGTYAFANLAPGPYVVREVVPAGYVRTFPVGSDHYDVTVVAGQTAGDKNFANYLVPPPPPPPPTGSLSGKKVRDVTGNGWSADDVPLGGVKVYLDLNKDGSYTAGEPSALTLADGTYKFAGLAPATYVVREVVPAGYLRTGPAVADNYVVNVAANADAGGNNFANWRDDCDDGAIACVTYVINGSTVVTDLRGRVHQGDQVTVNFTVKTGYTETLSLVSYKAPSGVWDATVAGQQTVFDLATGSFGPGTYALTVQVPNCYFQVDFVCGSAIDKLGPVGSNIFYSAQGRLFGADNGGTLARYDNAATISGRVLWDRDADGRVDAADTGIAGVTVRLTGTDSAGRTVSLTRTTRSDGSYSFADLRPGRYAVVEVQPTGFYDGKEILGTVNGAQEGRIAADDKFDQIDVLSGQQALGYVFLERR